MNFQCSLSICKQKFHTRTQIISHLKSHILGGHRVSCPAVSCSKTYAVASSFTSHLSRYHKVPAVTVDDITRPARDVGDTTPLILQSSSGPDSDDTVSQTDEGTLDNTDTGSAAEMNLKQQLLFYMSLRYKHLVPLSTIDIVMKEHANMSATHNNTLRQNIEEHLQGVDIGTQEKRALLSIFDEKLQPYSAMRSEYSRDAFMKSNLSYISPIAYDAGRQGSEPFYYVPILDTLKNMLGIPSILRQFNSPEESTFGVYRDIADGNAFKRNRFLSQGGRIQIILFQDGFQVVNPLGPAKKKHKMLGVYFTLGNLHIHNRSKTNSAQLVMLCNENFITSENIGTIFDPLLQDLKKLESVGIDIGTEDAVKGTIMCLVGDNLGSHWAGGFVTNFSTANHVCRYCTSLRTEMRQFKTPWPLRDIDAYEQAVWSCSQQQLHSFQGVKYASVFNNLEFFHVCQPGLPPCLAHDLFEGVVQLDMAIFIKKFISMGWFTLEYLNKKLDSFDYDTRMCRPASVKPGAKKLSGNASQIWAFLRIFPLLVYSKIQDSEDILWNAVLLLREIVEYICAPSISFGQISYLSSIISQYLNTRFELDNAAPFLPKHHYLCHYPWLITEFGPLINVWTLRFESKHSYFKSVVRHKPNFTNVAKSLAECYQGLMAYEQEMTGFTPGESEIDRRNCLKPDHFSNEMLSAFESNGFERQADVLLRSVDHKGTSYRMGQYVILATKDLDLELGKILVVVKALREVYLIVELCEAYFLPHIGIFKVNSKSDFKSVRLQELHDFYPLFAHSVNGEMLLCLKHSVLRNELR